MIRYHLELVEPHLVARAALCDSLRASAGNSRGELLTRSLQIVNHDVSLIVNYHPFWQGTEANDGQAQTPAILV